MIDVVTHLTSEAVAIIKDRDGNVGDEITEVLTRLLDETDFGSFKKMFVQAELPDVTLHTIDALERKKVLEESEPFGLDGAVYYKWTGKELEAGKEVK